MCLLVFSLSLLKLFGLSETFKCDKLAKIEKIEWGAQILFHSTVRQKSKFSNYAKRMKYIYIYIYDYADVAPLQLIQFHQQHWLHKNKWNNQ